MEDSFKKELLFKILVVGDYGAGKTSIIRRYAEGSFSSTYKITIGADFAIKQLEWNESTKVNLQLWDIAGHERFGYLTSVYYRYAVAAAIVFDLTRPQTFLSVSKWLYDLRDKATLQHGKPLPVILLANKGDIAADNLPPDIESFCNQNQILTWFITSAKENENIDEAMNLLVKQAVENLENNNVFNTDAVVTLHKEPISSSSINKRTCCRHI